MEQDNLCISWNFLPWKKFYRKSSSLQRKIYDAKQEKNKRKIKRLQKLLVKSKSFYYIAVKKVTDYYSFRGIFLSQKIKLDVVNEVYLNFYKWKNSLARVRLKANSVTLNCLKDEVVAYLMNYLIRSVYGNNFITNEYDLNPSKNETFLEYRRVSQLPFKRLFRISFLSDTYFRDVESLLPLPLKFKSTLFKSLVSTNSKICAYPCGLSFRRELSYLYFATILIHLKNLNLPGFLVNPDSIQESLFSYFCKRPSYSIHIGFEYKNILFLYKRFFKLSGFELSFNNLR